MPPCILISLSAAKTPFRIFIPRWAAVPDRTVDIPNTYELLRQGTSAALALRARLGITARSRSNCCSSFKLDLIIYFEISMKDYCFFGLQNAFQYYPKKN